MQILACIERATILAGLTLASVLLLLLIATWHSRTRPWGLLSLVALLVLIQACVLEIPRVDGFQHLHRSWQESLLSTAWPFLLVALVLGISLASIGVASRLRPGWPKPSIVAGGVALAVPAVFFVLGARRKLDAEGWAFLLTMPGLAEELVFRGVFQSLLNHVFGKPWRLANAEFGWGLVITSVLFAGFNGLTNVDAGLHPHVVLAPAIAPFLSSLVSGWVRERTDSVWPSVVGHNLSNIVIPVATLFA